MRTAAFICALRTVPGAITQFLGTDTLDAARATVVHTTATLRRRGVT